MMSKAAPMKRPAAWGGEPIQKRPSASEAVLQSWGVKADNDEDAQADSTSLTPQQRHVWKKNYDKLPEDIRKDYESTMQSGKMGVVKEATSIINAIVPKDIGYGGSITLDSATMNRYRKISKARKTTDTNKGWTFTQITGNGLLGSEEKLRQGMNRGDVIMKLVTPRVQPPLTHIF